MVAREWRALAWLALALVPVIAVAGIHKHVDHPYWTGDYDGLFRKYTKHYFGPHFDWRWFKAQAIAESGLNPDAHSPAGAKGIMQILPGTYEELREQNPYLATIDDPRWNIAAGIYYDHQLYRKWKDKRQVPIPERLSFAFASYNAGYGNLFRAFSRAQKELGEIKSWVQMEPYVPRETRAYVVRIMGLMQEEDQPEEEPPPEPDVQGS